MSAAARDIPDLAIVGAGPAGMTAALAARGAGLAVELIESAVEPGGQLRRIYGRVRGVPGDGPEASAPHRDGATLALALSARLASAGLAPRTGTSASGLVPDPHRPAITLAGGVPLAARAVLIASGLRPRTLGVPGEGLDGVSTSATRDRALFAGQPVVVAGGGDAAYENALLLAEAGCRVTLVVRGEPRARSEFRRRVADTDAITVLARTRVVEIVGPGRVTGVRVAGPAGEVPIEARGVFVKVGSLPNTEWCRLGVACDEEGYVRVDGRGATSAPGCWAAGDVIRPAALTLEEAAASATRAAAAITETLARGA